MDLVVYWFVWVVLKTLQALPLVGVAQLGRSFGFLFYYLDARHRRTALGNLQAVYGQEMSPRQIRRLAREHFRRLGENYASAVKTAAMSDQQLAPHLTVQGQESLLRLAQEERCQGLVVVIGHFGNFELYARATRGLEGYQFATTYRAFNQPRLNRLLEAVRAKSGCLFFERRSEASALRAAMTAQRIILGLVSDQHSGRGGVWIPFLGRECSMSPASAVFAQRYQLPLFPAVCYRVKLAQWRIEVGEEIPTLDANGRRRRSEDIMMDVNRVLEAAVRRDPANWFWVHDLWKPKKRNVSGRRQRRRRSKSSPASS